MAFRTLNRPRMPRWRASRPGGGVRWLCLALACAFAAGGCAGSREPGPLPGASAPSAPGRATAAAANPPTASPGLDGCLPPALGQIRRVRDAGGGTLTLAVVGSGRRVVVLSNESDENLCSWLPFTRRLTAAGYRVVLWDYGPGEPTAELRGLIRRFGAAHTVVMGASEGAKVSLIAAARTKRAVRGVISLSAESVLRPAIEVARSVRRVRSPLLLVTSARDPYGSAPAAREFIRAAPGTDKRLVVVPGTDHGTALLGGSAAATVVPEVLAFLRHAFAG